MARIWKLIRAAAGPSALFWFVAAAVLLADVSTAMAADPIVWPNMDVPFSRGPGSYLSLTKILLCWLLFLAWVKTTDMVGQDCERLKLSYVIWNSVVFFTFVVAFLLVWCIPIFALGFILMILAYAGPLAGYVVYRNSTVSAERRVFTRDYFQHLLSRKAAIVGVKIDPENPTGKKQGPPVNFTAQGGATDRDNAAHLLLARQSPGFPLARELIADMLDRRAEGSLLDYTAEGVAVRYQIDGVWHNYEPRDRASGDVMLAVFKTISALNVNERRAKQEGTFAAEYKDIKHICRFASQGVQTGERVVIQLADPKDRKWTFEELGMRTKIEEQLKELVGRSKGYILCSALPVGGLTTTLDTMIRTLDRFLRDTVAVEEVNHREHEIENVTVTTYDRAKGETPMTVLPKMVRSYPNVLVVRDVVDAQTVQFLCEQVELDRMAISGVRAKESAEALLRILMLKVPVGEFAPAVIAVINQRMIRRLCDKCKEAYAPPPEVLKQLGLPPDRIQALYRPPQPQPGQEPPKPCPECLGVGYLGRTSIFELLVVDDGVRKALATTPKVDLVRAAARKAGMRTLQEEGIVLVAKGVTSLPELMRVMKG